MRRSIIVAMLTLAAPAGAQQGQRAPEAAPARPPGNLGSHGLTGSVVAIDWAGGAVAVLPSGKPWTCDAR